MSCENYLFSTNDHTDRTAEIEQILKKYGRCELGAGLFFVRGVNMPESTMLSGAGNATKLLLDPALEEGYALKISSYCTIQNLMLTGSETEIPLPEKVGKRHGLVFLGNCDPDDETTWRTQIHNCVVHGCWFWSFTGGGITCNGTGFDIQSSMTVSDCHMSNCGAGIYIPYFSEFHRFTNVMSNRNLYGCVNNGGNNYFINCGFDSNKLGFLMDNSDGKALNNSHGSAIGCSFHHSDKNKGVGIHAIGNYAGFIFSGCQIGNSRIISENNIGFIFNAMSFLNRPNITIIGGATHLFQNCIFGQHNAILNIQDNDMVSFSGCYTMRSHVDINPNISKFMQTI